MVDVVDSKSTGGDTVPVRVRPPAPKIGSTRMGTPYFYCLWSVKALDQPNLCSRGTQITTFSATERTKSNRHIALLKKTVRVRPRKGGRCPPFRGLLKSSIGLICACGKNNNFFSKGVSCHSAQSSLAEKDGSSPAIIRLCFLSCRNYQYVLYWTKVVWEAIQWTSMKSISN